MNCRSKKLQWKFHLTNFIPCRFSSLDRYFKSFPSYTGKAQQNLQLAAILLLQLCLSLQQIVSVTTFSLLRERSMKHFANPNFVRPSQTCRVHVKKKTRSSFSKRNSSCRWSVEMFSFQEQSRIGSANQFTELCAVQK